MRNLQLHIHNYWGGPKPKTTVKKWRLSTFSEYLDKMCYLLSDKYIPQSKSKVALKHN